MTRSILLTTACAALLTSVAFAGQPMSDGKSGKGEVLPPIYGTGFYLGVQAGINAYQDYRGNDFTLGGNDVTLNGDSHVGFVGGLKLGYVFGTGTVRPAIEADLYYNAVNSDVTATVNGHLRNFNTDGNSNADRDTGAFLANFLLRFCFDRFQPYLGGGVGGYYAAASDVNFSFNGQRYNGNGSTSGFAWQLVAGSDYYFTEKVSLFAEYKWLNYENASMVDNDGRLSQQIAVLGLRWHF
jgi:opacity protein-like surface antigen